MLAGHPECLAEPAGPGAKEARVGDPAATAHLLEPPVGQRADEHRAGDPFFLADDFRHQWMPYER